MTLQNPGWGFGVWRPRWAALKRLAHDLWLFPRWRLGIRLRNKLRDDFRPPYLPLYLTAREWRALSYVFGESGGGFVFRVPDSGYVVVQSWPASHALDGHYVARASYHPGQDWSLGARRSSFKLVRS